MAQEEANDVTYDAVQQDTATDDSSTDETNNLEAVDDSEDYTSDDDTTEQETDDESDSEDEDPDSKDSEKSDETDSEEKPRGKKDANSRIRELNQRAKSAEQKAYEREQENYELRRQIEQANSTKYRPSTVDELVEQGLSEYEAKLQSMQESMEIKDYTHKVSELNSRINNEVDRVLDIPVFNPDSEDYDQEYANEVFSLYQEAAKPQTDPNTGYLIDAQVMPLTFYKRHAALYEKAQSRAKTKAQRSAERNLSRVEPRQSNAPRSTGDELDDLENRLSSLTF